MASKPTGTSGSVILNLAIVGSNAATRTYTIRATAQVSCSNGSTFANGVSWSLTPWGAGGSFDISGAGTQTIFVGDTTVTLNANGDATSVTETFNMGATGTSGMGGPTSVSATITLPALKVAPNTPTNVVATRVSDTQTKLTWNQTNASNGTPTSVLVQSSVNGAAYADLVSLGNATSVTVATAANRKVQYRVRSGNTAGTTAFSGASAPIYTTPGTPTNVVAAKNPSLDIDIAFSSTVAYTEHTHEVWHGVVAGGVTTWDGAALATLPSGTVTYTHAAPNAAQVHIYEIRSRAGALASAYAVSNSVQLLIAPNKPTRPAAPAIADKTQPVTYTWTHNTVDTTPQKAYEFSTSTDGGTTWVSSGKIVSAVASRTIAANTYAANVVLTTRVRTWGSATTGGSDGTGASPWSDTRATTYKSVPTASITSPANASTIHTGSVRVNVGFAQAEGATFVKAQVELSQAGTVLELVDSVNQVGITMATPLDDDVTYTLRARVQDSNGLWSTWVTTTFLVDYLIPVPATGTAEYLEDNGYVQLDVNTPDPVGNQEVAVTVTITRAINGVEEIIVQDYPVDTDLSFLDTTPTIHGLNHYTITTTSALGATNTTHVDLTTAECRRAFLSKGVGFATVVIFGGNLSVSESLSVASDTVQAAGRTKPIGLYGMETSVQLKVESRIFTGFGSTIDDLRDILLVPGKACYRDSSGRRVFGSVKGSVEYKKTDRGDLSFTMTETD